jgi:hypothetical protein
MHSLSRLANKDILGEVNNNQAFHWEDLYSNYSACMLGIIFSLLKNKKQSEELLQKVFIQLISERGLVNQRCNLCVHLYVYTFDFIMKYSQERSIDISENLRALPDFLQLMVIKNKNKGQVVVDNKNRLQYDLLPAFGLDSHLGLVAVKF